MESRSEPARYISAARELLDKPDLCDNTAGADRPGVPSRFTTSTGHCKEHQVEEYDG
jgi:hypothetical protein